METNSVKFFNNQQYRLPEDVLPPVIVAWKLKTPENYGNIIRLADTVGCAKVIFVSRPDQLAERKVKRTAGDSYGRVICEYVTPEQIFEALPTKYELVAVETAEGSQSLYQSNLPVNIAIVVGNEKAGIGDALLQKCCQIVHIPLTGNCTSLNVSHATSVALFEWLRQILK